MRPVAIIGAGTTKFGRSQWSLLKLMAEAAHGALKDGGVKPQDIQAVYVANMGSAHLNRQAGLASAFVDRMNLYPIPADTIENGPASGASAVKTGFMAVASGMYDVVLVIGAERMRVVNGMDSTDFVAFLSHPRAEYIYGTTLPSLAGMFARMYMAKYGVTSDHLGMVAVKNHSNAMLNPNAHIRAKISLEGILHSPHAIVNNPYVAEPLRMFDCCPVSDGACAVILCAADLASKFAKTPIKVAGVGQATDTHAVHERPDPTELRAVRLAADKAFEMAGLERSDISVLELHDAFTILEIAESEHAGFFPLGEGHLALERGETSLTGRYPVNPCGGLKAKGHPVGATGVSQIVELVYQLRGEAGARQIKNAEHGFACNFGGFGNNVVCTILSKGV